MLRIVDKLQSAPVRRHGSRHARAQHVRRRHRQPEVVRGKDRRHRHQLSAGALRIGQCSLPIFSPTVTTMRFQPTMVPMPSASATATFTHLGMNLVDLSTLPW